jgi:hypothetical protein
MTIIKEFGIDYCTQYSDLSCGYIASSIFKSKCCEPGRFYSIKYESSGWTITGQLDERFSDVVLRIRAHHDVLGGVWGYMWESLRATNPETFDSLITHHPFIILDLYK